MSLTYQKRDETRRDKPEKIYFCLFPGISPKKNSKKTERKGKKRREDYYFLGFLDLLDLFGV